MDQTHRSLGDLLLGLDIRLAMLADLEHVAVLADAYSAAIGALQLALLLEGSEILADAVLGHLELLAQITHADLAVVLQHIHDDFLTLFQEHLFFSIKICHLLHSLGNDY